MGRKTGTSTPGMLRYRPLRPFLNVRLTSDGTPEGPKGPSQGIILLLLPGVDRMVRTPYPLVMR